MRKYAPMFTLLSVVGLGVGLLVANMLTGPTPGAPAAAPAGAGGADAGSATTLAAPAAPPPAPAAPSYTGRSAGNEVTLAFAFTGDRAAAYVSDGRKIEAWFEGAVTGDRLTMRGDRDSLLTATVDPRTLFGTLRIDGAEWPFSAKAVKAPAGPYEGRGTVQGVPARVGWIVEETGNVTGLTDLGGRIVPAPRINEKGPVDIVVEGERMTVTAVAGDAEVVE